MKWTPEKTKRLKKFILAGYRYDEIAEKFGDGCTKNAVKSRARVCAMPGSSRKAAATEPKKFKPNKASEQWKR